MLRRKISPEPLLQVTRKQEVVIVEFISEQEDFYKWEDYKYTEAEDQAKATGYPGCEFKN